VAVAVALLVRRWVPVEVLERHNEVAGFIYAVIGVLYAVLLGFTAIIVWERYDQAQAEVEKEANELGDLFRDAQAFPDETRRELETKLHSYVRLVVEKEWSAMAEHRSSPEAWEAYNELWQAYYRLTPQNEQERVWYTQSLTRLNELGDQRRLRMLSSRSEGVPTVMRVVLVGWLQLPLRHEEYHGAGPDDGRSRHDDCSRRAFHLGSGTALCWDHSHTA
jgi:Protein of unknown function (DUF4239)